jgi:hypothetical protein
MILTETDRETLHNTLNAKNAEITQARMANALLLLADGLSTEDVAGLLFLEEESVAGWKAMFFNRNPNAG